MQGMTAIQLQARAQQHKRAHRAVHSDATPWIDLRTFIADAWHVVEPATPYVHGWHLDAIAEHLEAVTRGEIRNLIINIPPRHMKSLSVCVFWSCWEWTTQAGEWGTHAGESTGDGGGCPYLHPPFIVLHSPPSPVSTTPSCPPRRCGWERSR